MSAAGVWKEANAPDGRTYYYNTATNETRWDKPAEMGAPAGPTPASAWRTHTAPDGRQYYEDTINKTTTWEMPEVLKAAQAQTPARSHAPNFVSSSPATNLKSEPNDFRQPERNLTDRMPGFGAAAVKEEQFATLQEAEAVFFKLLKRLGVESDWSWERMIKEAVRDPGYRAIQDARDRKDAFDKYIEQARAEEKEREKDRKAKLGDEFMQMLKSHPEIKFYTRWSTARPMIEQEMVFKAAKHEDERIQLFNEYRQKQYKEHVEKEKAAQQAAIAKLSDLLPKLNMSPLTRWSEAQALIAESEEFQDDKGLQFLPKIELLKAFEAHQKESEAVLHEQRTEARFVKARRERQNRDAYINLMGELRHAGKIRANTKWSDLQPLIEDDPRYDAMLGQSGSTPMELFWDAVEEEDHELRRKRNVVYDVLEAERFEVTPETPFDEFKSVVQADRQIAAYDKETLRLIYDRVIAKVQERAEKERHKAERAARHQMDDLRSRMKKLNPPVEVDDTWEQVRPRLEKYDEYRALETDDLRRAAFDKHIRRLKEKEEDDRRSKDRDRERERTRDRDRERDRDHRNGRLKREHTATPEADAYEADRRKAQAARERTYGSRGIPGVSPPPRSRDWDADRYDGRGDSRDGRDSRKVSSSNHYDRDRRDREAERERSYLSRADPSARTTVLEYGDEEEPHRPSSRRRRDSDGESVRSSKVSRRSFYNQLGRLSPVKMSYSTPRSKGAMYGSPTKGSREDLGARVTNSYWPESPRVQSSAAFIARPEVPPFSFVMPTHHVQTQTEVMEDVRPTPVRIKEEVLEDASSSQPTSPQHDTPAVKTENNTSSQRLKRTASPKDTRKKEPEKAAAPPEPEAGFHSGSEEGEIEED